MYNSNQLLLNDNYISSHECQRLNTRNQTHGQQYQTSGFMGIPSNSPPMAMAMAMTSKPSSTYPTQVPASVQMHTVTKTVIEVVMHVDCVTVCDIFTLQFKNQSIHVSMCPCIRN